MVTGSISQSRRRKNEHFELTWTMPALLERNTRIPDKIEETLVLVNSGCDDSALSSDSLMASKVPEVAATQKFDDK
jgi:hypothetical protein